MSSHKTVTYHAGAQVLINQQSPAFAVIGTGVPRADPVRNALTQSLLANGPAVAERVDKLPEFQGANRAALAGYVTVAASDTSDLLSFASTASTPEYAVELVNAYATEYLAWQRHSTTASIHQLRLKVQSQMDTLQLEGRGGSALYANFAQQAQALQI